MIASFFAFAVVEKDDFGLDCDLNDSRFCEEVVFGGIFATNVSLIDGLLLFESGKMMTKVGQMTATLLCIWFARVEAQPTRI